MQKHAATRLHYDFRLELDGTLKSWAVPKGPSLDPSQKRLAVHVEDHPLEYAKFEGVIPPKQYGAGTVLIWDRGTWQPQGNPRDGYRKGVLKFRLDGRKLHGAWTLVRMQGRRDERGDSDKENWLLIKEQDADARKGAAGEIVDSSTKSVESGRDLKDIADEGCSASGSLTEVHCLHRSSVRQQLARASSSRPVPSAQDFSSVTGAVKAHQPDWIVPQLATLVDRMPTDEGGCMKSNLTGTACSVE